jgi:hypothetical protein
MLLHHRSVAADCEAIQIVSRESATLGLAPGREIRRFANRSHRQICKFSGADDLEWCELQTALGRAARLATAFTGYSPTMSRRAAIFEAQVPYEEGK